MSTRRRELLTHHLPALLWSALIAVALVVPTGPDLPEWVPRFLHFQALDKVIHGLMFFVAGWLLARSLACFAALRHPALTAFALLVVYGGALETAQHLATARSGELADAAADAVGAAAGVAAATWLVRPRSADAGAAP